MAHAFTGKWITDSKVSALPPRNVFHRQHKKVDLPCNEHRNRHILFRKKFSCDDLPAQDRLSVPVLCLPRAQFVQVFANISGINTSNNHVKSGFKDVKKGQWYTAAVTWAAKAGIVKGVGDNKFDPKSLATRAQGATILTNFHKAYMR